MKNLFLFDIDGTLLRTGGAGTRSFDKAFFDIFGIKDAFKNISMHGMLDPLIFDSALKRHGIAPNGHFEMFCEGYLYYLKKEALNPENWNVVEGVFDFLKKHKNNAVFALLTGNIFEGAKIKLETLGLWDYFPTPEIGAFGSDATERKYLGDKALKKIEIMLGLKFSPENIYVFGDTKHDIGVAKHIGGKSLALTSGGIAKGELLLHNPDFVAENFNDFMNLSFSN
jgi:phosphoglycolate phosphatase-like HAD superfamily hydrolase